MLHMPHTDLVSGSASALKHSPRERWLQGLDKFRPQGMDRSTLLHSRMLYIIFKHAAVFGAGIGLGWKLHSRRAAGLR